MVVASPKGHQNTPVQGKAEWHTRKKSLHIFGAGEKSRIVAKWAKLVIGQKPNAKFQIKLKHDMKTN